MSTIKDPLAKPEWPVVDSSIQDAVVNLLVGPCARGTSETVKVGFNPTMAAIEDHLCNKGKVEALFVARSDLHAAECLPLALASSAGQIRLVTLPPGSRVRLPGGGVIALCSSTQETQLLKLVEEIGPAKLEWVYQGAELVQKKRTPARNPPAQNPPAPKPRT